MNTKEEIISVAWKAWKANDGGINDALLAAIKAAAPLLAAQPAKFANAGDSEATFIADAERLNCPTCGGSGHIDDARAAHPNCGACPGDGSVCGDACRVEVESPPTGVLHPDLIADVELHPATKGLVLEFARALALKLSAAEKKYGYAADWLHDDWREECQRQLTEHVAKGDPRDVAAYCAFAWFHDWPTVATQPVSQPPNAQQVAQAGVPEGYPKGFIWVTGTTRERKDFADALRDMAHELRQDDEAVGIRADYAQADLAIAIADALESDTLWRQSLAAAPMSEGN